MLVLRTCRLWSEDHTSISSSCFNDHVNRCRDEIISLLSTSLRRLKKCPTTKVGIFRNDKEMYKRYFRVTQLVFPTDATIVASILRCAINEVHCQLELCYLASYQQHMRLGSYRKEGRKEKIASIRSDLGQWRRNVLRSFHPNCRLYSPCFPVELLRCLTFDAFHL